MAIEVLIANYHPLCVQGEQDENVASMLIEMESLFLESLNSIGFMIYPFPV